MVLIGVSEEERASPQPLEISVVIFIKAKLLYSDQLSSTYDYSTATSTIERLTGLSYRYRLMEYLAQSIVDAILASSMDVVGVEVAVRKLKPPVPIALRDAGFVMQRFREQS
jgi:dihydroneopterin aldolase